MKKEVHDQSSTLLGYQRKDCVVRKGGLLHLNSWKSLAHRMVRVPQKWKSWQESHVGHLVKRDPLKENAIQTLVCSSGSESLAVIFSCLGHRLGQQSELGRLAKVPPSSYKGKTQQYWSSNPIMPSLETQCKFSSLWTCEGERRSQLDVKVICPPLVHAIPQPLNSHSLHKIEASSMICVLEEIAKIF